MKLKIKWFIMVFIALFAIIISIGVGTVYVSPIEIINIILSKLGRKMTDLPPLTVSIIWSMRMPRVFLAFLVGAILSVSGAIMQSVLKNTLSSSYTLGVSSGAAFGIGLMTFLGINSLMLGVFTFPLIGLIFGVLMVVLVVVFASAMDKNMENQTIVLVGMVFSLFIGALLTLMYALSGETLQKMVYWQMGSFALKDWSFIYALMPIAIVGTLILMKYTKELDNLTFGEEAALAVGIDVKKTKWILLFISAALTGCAVAASGIIGFVDLIIPHIVRKIFGSSHKFVIPASFILGGSFMVIADSIARTIVTPHELPIGAVTALIGAPFFVYIYFNRRRAK